MRQLEDCYLDYIKCVYKFYSRFLENLKSTELVQNPVGQARAAILLETWGERHFSAFPLSEGCEDQK